MTENRTRECLEKLIGHIVEQKAAGEAIFEILHDKAGIQLEELHEYGIRQLDWVYKKHVPRELLKTKADRCYEAFRRQWCQMTPEQLIEKHEKLYAVSVSRSLLCNAVTEEQARWLLQFKNPLEVVSDAWLLANDPDGYTSQDQFGSIIDELRDRGSAETEYELEDITLL